MSIEVLPSELLAGAMNEVGLYAVSYHQEAMLRIWQRNPKEAIPNNSLLFRIREQVNTRRIQWVCDRLIDRHPMLGTTYTFDGNRVWQKPPVGTSYDFRVDNVSVNSGKALEQHVAEDCQAPFDLLNGPVFRVRVYTGTADEYRVLFCTSAITADADSLRILLDDFIVFHTTFMQGRTHSLPTLGQDYFQHAQQERRYSTEASPPQKELLNQQAVLDLPLDHRRPSTSVSAQWSELPVAVSMNFERSLALWVAQESTDVASAYLAAYSILLSRYSNTSEVLVGAYASTRSNSPSGQVVGEFSNVVPVVFDCRAEQSFRELAAQVASTVSASGARQLPFPLLTKGLEGDAITVSPAPCSACFSWEDWGLPDGMQLLEIESQPLAAIPFDLALQVQSLDGVRKIRFSYREDRFERETIVRMSRQWIRLLEQAVDQPAAPVGELDMLTEEERAVVLAFNAGSQTPYPYVCVHELVAEQAKLRPEAEAVAFGDTRLSYRQLDERSNQVANFLLAQQINPGDRVGIFMDRSADMITSMLGVLKAGGAYVPIDPVYPQERLKFIADDISVSWVLSSHQVHTKLPSAAPFVLVDGPDSPVRTASRQPVANRSTPESIAALIYTSGSTGQPKAACIPHRAIVRTVRDTNYIQATPEDRVAQVASPSFDAALMEIWMALINGGTLVGMRRETLLDPVELSKILQTERISVIVLNTAYMHQIGRDVPEALSGVRKIIFGGEAAEPAPLRRLLKKVSPGALINGYGPAEGCVTTTFYEISSLPEDAMTVPIGRPVKNSQVYLLDPHARLVPIGVQGEIYIGGEGVALGYWNRPELNAQRFIPDSFSGIPGRLLYRTGDLGRLRADGQLEFMGRMDEQVKIRGHRIELAEVRQAIVSHADVSQVFLMVREDQPGDKRLVAYVTLRRPLALAQTILKQHVQEKLPAHTQPAAFVIVDSIPLTTNGKVDRKALPAPLERPDLGIDYEEPQTDFERMLTSVWQELLRIDHVGLNDNFFDLGGHSLLASRLVARIEKETGKNIPVATLFEAPTIARLAQKLMENSFAAGWSPLVELHRPTHDTANEPFFCIHSLGANLVSFHKVASLLRDRPIYGLQPHGLDGRERPFDNLEEMAAAYVQEIQKKQPHGPYYLGGVCIGGVLAYEMAQQLTAAGEEVALIALIDSFMPGKLPHLHARSRWTEYLDRHLGEALLLQGSARLKYLGRWIANGGIVLSRFLGWRDNSSLARATRQVGEAHMRAVLTYEPKPYAGKITQFICSDAAYRSYEDRRLAWSTLALGGFEIHLVPGNHLTMVEEPHVRTLAKELQLCLDTLGGLSRAVSHVMKEQTCTNIGAKPIAAARQKLRCIGDFPPAVRLTS